MINSNMPFNANMIVICRRCDSVCNLLIDWQMQFSKSWNCGFSDDQSKRGPMNILNLWMRWPIVISRGRASTGRRCPQCVLIRPSWRHRCYPEPATEHPRWPQLLENTTVSNFDTYFNIHLKADLILPGASSPPPLCECGLWWRLLYRSKMATATVSANRNGQHHPPQLPVTKNSFQSRFRRFWSFYSILGVLYFDWAGKDKELGGLGPLVHPSPPPPPTQVISCSFSLIFTQQPHRHPRCRHHHPLVGDQSAALG